MLSIPCMLSVVVCTRYPSTANPPPSLCPFSSILPFPSSSSFPSSFPFRSLPFPFPFLPFPFPFLPFLPFSLHFLSPDLLSPALSLHRLLHGSRSRLALCQAPSCPSNPQSSRYPACTSLSLWSITCGMWPVACGLWSVCGSSEGHRRDRPSRCIFFHRVLPRLAMIPTAIITVVIILR